MTVQTAAVASALPGAGWQRCRTHYLRNLLTKVPKSAQPGVATLVRTIFDQADAATVAEQFGKVVGSLVGFQPETGSSPISVPGLPHAVKDRWGSSNGCQIEWQASFGTIFVTASAGAGPHDNDPIDQCVNTESWIMLVLPSLPK